MAGMFKRLASGAAFGGVSFVVAALASLWATPKLYEGVGAEAYGVLGLLIGVQGALLLLLSSGGVTATLVLLADGDAQTLKTRGRAMAGWAVLAAALALIAGWALGTPLLGSIFWHDAMSLDLWLGVAPWAGLSWALQIMCQALWAAQRARQRLVQAELQQGLWQTLAILAGPWALWRGTGFSGIVESQALAWLLALVAGLIWEATLPGGLNLMPKEDRPTWRLAWKTAVWTTVALGATGVLLYGDRVFFLARGVKELAAYSAATSLSLRAASLFGLLGPLLLPALSSARNDPERWAGMQSLVLRTAGIGAGSIFVPLAAGGAVLLGAWVGPEAATFGQAWMVLLAAGGLALALSNAYMAVLLGMDGAKQAAFSALAGVAVGVLVGKVAQAHGAQGAVWMGLAGHTLTVLWRGWAVAKLGLERPGWGWAWLSLPWLLAAGGGVWVLRALDFPRWFGLGLVAQLESFAVAGVLIAGLALGADAMISVPRKRWPLWQQLLRLRRSPAA